MEHFHQKRNCWEWTLKINVDLGNALDRTSDHTKIHFTPQNNEVFVRRSGSVPKGFAGSLIHTPDISGPLACSWYFSVQVLHVHCQDKVCHSGKWEDRHTGHWRSTLSVNKGWGCCKHSGIGHESCIYMGWGRGGFLEDRALGLTRHGTQGVCQVLWEEERERRLCAQVVLGTKHTGPSKQGCPMGDHS